MRADFLFFVPAVVAVVEAAVGKQLTFDSERNMKRTKRKMLWMEAGSGAMEEKKKKPIA